MVCFVLYHVKVSIHNTKISVPQVNIALMLKQHVANISTPSPNKLSKQYYVAFKCTQEYYILI